MKTERDIHLYLQPGDTLILNYIDNGGDAQTARVRSGNPPIRESLPHIDAPNVEINIDPIQPDREIVSIYVYSDDLEAQMTRDVREDTRVSEALGRMDKKLFDITELLTEPKAEIRTHPDIKPIFDEADPQAMLDSSQVADLTGLCRDTISRFARVGGGPRFSSNGQPNTHSRRWKRGDVLDWMKTERYALAMRRSKARGNDNRWKDRRQK